MSVELTSRPDPTPEEAASEADAWITAARNPGKAEPFTAEETSMLNGLLVAAKDRGDDEAFRRLKELAGDPAGFRRLMKDVAA